jgi:hypothetical protein
LTLALSSVTAASCDPPDQQVHITNESENGVAFLVNGGEREALSAAKSHSSPVFGATETIQIENESYEIRIEIQGGTRDDVTVVIGGEADEP